MPNAEFIAALRDQKLLAVPAGDNVVRLLPPLTVSDDEIREALDRIRAGRQVRGRQGRRPQRTDHCREH